MPFRGRGNRVITGGGRPRRPMDWECGDFDAVAGNNRLCRWLIPPSQFRERYTDPTLMSTMVWLSLAIPAQGDNTGVVAFGIIVVSAFDDVDPSADACPGPISDCNADWVYLNVAPGFTYGARETSMNTELDRRSQAKRRLGNDKGILLVYEGLFLTTPGDFHAHVRCLIKE